MAQKKVLLCSDEEIIFLASIGKTVKEMAKLLDLYPYQIRPTVERLAAAGVLKSPNQKELLAKKPRKKHVNKRTKANKRRILKMAKQAMTLAEMGEELLLHPTSVYSIIRKMRMAGEWPSDLVLRKKPYYQRRWEAFDKQVQAAYARGRNCTEIAKLLDARPIAVKRAIERLGLPALLTVQESCRLRNVNIAEAYRKGRPASQLALQYGLSRARIHQILAKVAEMQANQEAS